MKVRIIYFASFCCCDCTCIILLPFLPIIILFFIGSSIVNLVLFIILSVNYFNGDTSTYVDFLECGNVDKGKFNSHFGEGIQDLKGVFIPFFILNIIYLVASCCSGAANKGNSS